VVVKSKDVPEKTKRVGWGRVRRKATAVEDTKKKKEGLLSTCAAD